MFGQIMTLKCLIFKQEINYLITIKHTFVRSYAKAIIYWSVFRSVTGI